MSKFRRCPYCQSSFLPSIYRPQQVVCSQPECQRRRRADYHRKKLATDSEYRQVVRDSQKQWWGEHPHYQKQRRQENPKLGESNRQRQRQAKSVVARPEQRKFLGFSFTREREPRRRIAPKAIARFKKRIREQASRTRGISLVRMVKEITTYLRGWLGYFGDCQTPSVLRRLEAWLRHRLRSVAWKQWKQGRTRFPELRKRNVSKELAAQTAGSPHGPWRIANSPALALALPNAYFAELGLPPMAVRS